MKSQLPNLLFVWISFDFNKNLTWAEDAEMQLKFLEFKFAVAWYTLPCMSQLACIEHWFFFLIYIYMLCSELASAGVKKFPLWEVILVMSRKLKLSRACLMSGLWSKHSVNDSSSFLGKLSAYIGHFWWAGGCVWIPLYPTAFGIGFRYSWMGLWMQAWTSWNTPVVRDSRTDCSSLNSV